MAALWVLLGASAAFAATPVGTAIDNTATVTYGTDSPNSVPSNTVQVVTVARPRTPSTIKFLEYAPDNSAATAVTVSPDAYRSGSSASASFVDESAPVPLGSKSPLDLSQPLPLVATTMFHAGDPIFVEVTDQDQNLDPTRLDTVLATVTATSSGTVDVLRLTETGPNTGVFIGYIPSSGNASTASYSGVLPVTSNTSIKATYTDPVDGSDASTTAATVDPLGEVFDSQTGLPVSGATVTLINADTGQPAVVYGDDGVSAYPATVVSGGSATDASGKVYHFQPGRYRFPVVLPGHYRLKVVPPLGYAFPSSVATSDLQDLPAAPFSIADPGSRGKTFTLNPGPVFRIDLPLDSTGSGLWVSITAGNGTASTGDFVPYQVQVENPAKSGTATGVTATAQLPLGFHYRKGSTRIDGQKAPDPTLSADGRTLSFPLGDLDAGKSETIQYVVEVAAGAPVGQAVTAATARTASGVGSNRAKVAVTVQSPFLNNATILMGRVVAGACSDDPNAGKGIAGVRIYLEDGSYVVTDKEGRYHFEGVTPGVHVVQLDLDSLPPQYEVVPCEKNSRFAGRAFSRFVDLQGGTLWRADFHVALRPRARGNVSIALHGALAKGTASFHVPMRIGGVPLSNLRLSLLLPQGMHYIQGSSALGGRKIPDPQAGFGGILTYRLGDFPAGRQAVVAFRCRIGQKSAGELPVRAILTFDSPAKKNQRTPMAENLLQVGTDRTLLPMPEFIVRPHFPTLGATLSKTDKAKINRLADKLRSLKIIRLYVVGHTDDVRIAPRERHLYADNVALSEARARSVGRYLGQELDLPPSKIVLSGRGAANPVADNATAAGRALNRFVDVRVQCEKVLKERKLHLVKNRSGERKITTQGRRPGEGPAGPPKKPADDPLERMPQFGKAWVASAKPGFEWLWPQATLHPPIPSIKAAVKCAPKDKVELLHDGKPVDPLSFDGTLANGAGTVAVSLWRGIGLHLGDNTFELIVRNAQGKVIHRRKRVVHYSGPPVNVVLVRKQSTLLANGKTPPVLAVRFTDKDGFPARKGVVGDFTVDLPYTAYNRKRAVENSVQDEKQGFRPKFQVGADGIARIPLTPTSNTGEVTLHFKLNQQDLEIHAWLQPKMRDWILVGLAQGTVGYNAVSGHMEPIASVADKNLYHNGRVAFFAKGRIKGKWLLTMAYDSAKRGRNGKSLYQTIDPNAYYTLYGDATNQGYDAASGSKLYLKIERDQFYALFGDFNTGLTVTELSRYSRSLTGLKTELNTKHYSVNAFAADTAQSFARDEIRGDGTSGLYHLSHKNIVINSEKVTIETRDRFRSEVILSSKPLTRYTDYDIDYDAGTLFFKQPIPSRDENLNPVYIVVDYETNDGQARTFTYGGRAAAKMFKGKLVLGATGVHEGSTDGNLYGLDTTWKITRHTQLHAEAATSKTGAGAIRQSGNAWLAELTHRAGRLNGQVYYREQTGGFGLGQLNGSESGTRKFGLDGDWNLSKRWTLNALAYRQVNLSTGGREDVAQAQAKYTAKHYSLLTGLRQANEQLGTGQNESSSQITLGGAWHTLDNRLTLHVTHDQSLNGSGAAADYPTRTDLGLDYRLSRAVSLFANQEFTWGQNENTQNTQVGMKTTPWKGGQVNSSLGRQIDENGERVFAEFGLIQAWKVTDHLSLDGSLERSQTLRHPGNASLNVNQAPASGAAEDFTAVSLGANYKEKKWSWDNRIEYRTSTTEEKWGLFSAIVGEVHQGLGLSARAQIFLTKNQGSGDTTSGDLRFGLAYRPFDTRWIVLDRLDLLLDSQTASPSYNNWRIVNNLNANFRPSAKTQVSLLYGAKYVRENVTGDNYSGYTDLMGAEGRYDLSERLDVGLRGSVLHSWNAGQLNYSSGASIGYNVVKNTWVSLGYNLVGFEDQDFSADNYTAQGPFVRFRVKFDQASVGDAVRYLNRL